MLALGVGVVAFAIGEVGRWTGSGAGDWVPIEGMAVFALAFAYAKYLLIAAALGGRRFGTLIAGSAAVLLAPVWFLVGLMWPFILQKC